MNEFVLWSGNSFVSLTMINFLKDHPASDVTSIERAIHGGSGHLHSPPKCVPLPVCISATQAYEALLGNNKVISNLKLPSKSGAFSYLILLRAYMSG